MLENLRRSMGLRLARWQFRKVPNEIVTFTDALSSAQRILLIMPLQGMQLLRVVMVIDLVRNKFKGENITVVTAEHSVELMNLLPHSRFIRIAPSDLTRLFLPRREVFQGIKGAYDVAIDLNLDFVLPSGYICKASRARVRIGFTMEGADAFYNFQVNTNPGQKREKVYDRLAACLQMF